MYKKIKFIHIIGVIMFFGSILGHAIAGIVSASSNDPHIFNIVRQVIEVETLYLTIPGLIIFSLSGIAMIIMGKLKVSSIRWLLLHCILGTFVIINAYFILLPVGDEILLASNNLITGTGAIEIIQTLKSKEAMFGAFNIIACLILVSLAVLKPKLAK